MRVLATCKIEDGPINISSIINLWRFSRRSRQLSPQSVVGPNFELNQDFMIVFITCKDEEDSIKNGGARVYTAS